MMRLTKERVPCISIPDEILDNLPEAVHIALFALIQRYESKGVTKEFLAERLNVKIEKICIAWDDLHRLEVIEAK